MLKSDDPVKTFEDDARKALYALLGRVPIIDLKDSKHEPSRLSPGNDLIATVKVHGRPHTLVCELKSNGQPRHVRAALLQLYRRIAEYGKNATPILIAPYLSQEARAICREQGVGYIDLVDNASIAFDGVFIERQAAEKPLVERRELRTIFKPKAAQVLRTMLSNPYRAWRVAELANAAHVSLGHVSNIRVALLGREWAQVTAQGLSLVNPGALLDAWRDAYELEPGRCLRFYTTLHGQAFDDAARTILQADGGGGRAVFASFSAARWIAPFGRTGMQHFYADGTGLVRLQSVLQLSSAAKGENVTIVLPKEAGVFLDTVEPVSGVVCTSPVQTYLDLAVAGERGREAADHLRREMLAWTR